MSLPAQNYPIMRKGTWSKKYQFLAQKWSKIATQKKLDFCVFANHLAVHSGGVSRGGSVAVAVGVSDMGQVTRYT